MRNILYLIISFVTVVTLSICFILPSDPLLLKNLGSTKSLYYVIISLFGICDTIILPLFIGIFIFTVKSLSKYYSEGF